MSAFRLPVDVKPTRYALRFDLDLASWRFSGHERCELVLDEPRSGIVVHARDLDISDVRASSATGPIEVRTALDPSNDALTITFDSKLEPGSYAFELDLAGPIRDDLKALYRSTRGDERYAVTTLWPAESRRLYVCFDEPRFKARFALELVTAADVVAIANSRVLDRVPLADGRLLWRFAETEPLSPYLLAFAVGPFDGTPEVATRSGRPVRIWVPRGLAADGIYARDAQRDCIDRLEEYTAIPYPYDKVEGVGVADFPAGAMENPGAVTYRLELVTTDPTKASARALKSTVSVAAHELTHMWWGNLATLEWWDDLWLSESFATFVGHKVEDALHPEWRIWRDFAWGTTYGLRLDALASTHAIHSPAESAAAALQRVDAVTYQKGAAVLRMLETYLGEETFREGVRIYLRRHAGSTATASDFWRALDEASGQNVTRVAKAWITKPGHPLIEIRAGDGVLELAQRRFFADPEAPASAQLWPVPLVLRTPSGETRVLLEGARSSLADPGQWIHPDARAAGFYRFKLEPDLRLRLLPHLQELSPEERLLLCDNDWALLQAGAMTVADHVALLRALEGERDRVVLQVVHVQLQWLATHAGRGVALRGIVQALYAPVLASLGRDPRPDEGEDDQELRAVAIRALGEVAADEDIRRDAGQRIRAHLDGRTQDRNLIAAFAAVAARDGDAALQARYAVRIREGDPQEIRRFLPALALFPDDASTQATLARMDDRTIRDQDLRDIFGSGLANPLQRSRYWSGFRERYRERIAPLEAMVLTGILSTLSRLTQPQLASEADSFLASIRSSANSEVVDRTRESLRLQTAAAERIGHELSAAEP